MPPGLPGGKLSQTYCAKPMVGTGSGCGERQVDTQGKKHSEIEVSRSDYQSDYKHFRTLRDLCACVQILADDHVHHSK